MATTNHPEESAAKHAVLSFINALNTEDFDAARQYAHNDLKFDGVMGSREGAETYFQDMQRMRFKYDIKKTFVDADDVCLIFDINMGAVTLLTCGWYHTIDGKISTIRVIFDPRPLLK
jgi:limonene-1,2-epoxide hydrolase